MTQITYINGDATQPVGNGIKIITHCVNDIGVWGGGFVVAISKKWSHAKTLYQRWISRVSPSLGKVQILRLEQDIILANLVGQSGVGPDENGNPPVRYKAIREGFKNLKTFAIQENYSIHMPRLGCGLAGGSWSIIENLIHEELNGLSVYVYDYGSIPWNP